MVSIPGAVLHDDCPRGGGLQTGDARGFCSADVIINILSRQREPTAPLTILTTSLSLRLRQEPLVDCARYDCLRRAIYGERSEILTTMSALKLYA